MDLFGEAAKGKLRGSAEPLRIEREDGYSDLDTLDLYFASEEEFHRCERDALALARGRVLDIGLGAGRVSLSLQGKGLEVVGIDLSDGMLEVARERGVREALKMSACDLRFPKGRFDTAVAFGNNFGLCGSPEGVMGMLLRLRDIVADHGVFLAESIDPMNTTNKQHLSYHERNRARGRMAGHVTMRFSYKGKVGDWFDLLLVTPTEMKILAERTGWYVEKTFYDCEDSPVFVCVLRKA